MNKEQLQEYKECLDILKELPRDRLKLLEKMFSMTLNDLAFARAFTESQSHKEILDLVIKLRTEGE